MTNLFTPVSIKPKTIEAHLLLTAMTAVSHHDPAVSDKSNSSLFNRQKQILDRADFARMPSAESVARVAAAAPVSKEIAEIFEDFTFAEFASCLFVRTFLDLYNDEDGSGIFSGAKRYARLEQRLASAAVRTSNLPFLWNLLCRTLHVEMAAEDDANLFNLFALARAGQLMIIETIKNNSLSIVQIARLWHQHKKLTSPAYAAKMNEEIKIFDRVMSFPIVDSDNPNMVSSRIVVEVPAMSGNGLRHEIVRAPGMRHLFGALGFSERGIGKGELLTSVEAVFYNGGNIAQGAKQPSNPHALAARVRENFPLLELIGGVSDSFDFGESRLKLSNWLVCRENRAALEGTKAADLPNMSLSAFDMLDDFTHTRQAGRLGAGQMIQNFEGLCPGTQIFVRFVLPTETRHLTQGALCAAVDTFLNNAPTIGGQSARGLGNITASWLEALPEMSLRQGDYEDYLETNKEQLREFMIAGTLGSGSKILT